MATIPTPEEAGRAILDVFQEHNVRPGGMLFSRSLVKLSARYKADELNSGIQWLVDQGYVEQKEVPAGSIHLTEAGFAAV